jgi:hypothetical protein
MAAEPQVRPDTRGEVAFREREERIAALAQVQHGTVARRQLIALGFSHSQIDRRIAQGRLHPMYRGVYAVGHRVLGAKGRWMAAVLAAGEGGLVSHRAGARLWELSGVGASIIEVTAPRRVSRPGLRTYVSDVPADERAVRDGIPVTTVARTLLDLAAVLEPVRLEQVVSQAEARLLGDSPGLLALIDRYPGRRGLANLRSVLKRGRLGLDIAHSDLEIRFLAFVDQCGLPRPEVNVWLELDRDRIEVDCLWRAQRLIVEVDSRAHHLDVRSFESDRARDRRLLAAGFVSIRVTSRALELEPRALEGDLRSALSRRNASSPR